MPIGVKRFAIRYFPPSMIVEYDKNGKLRRRRIPLRSLNENAKPQTILEDITKKHADILGATVVSHTQLRKLITRMIDTYFSAKEKKTKSSIPAKSATNSQNVIPQPSNSTNTNLKVDPRSVLSGIPEDLNKLDDQELKKVKSKMDVLFQQNQKKPGDPGYQYDKREEFKPTGTSDWDDEEDLEEDFDIDDDF